MSRAHRTFHSALVLASLVGMVFDATVWAFDRMALWDLVNMKCVPHLIADQNPSPCEHIYRAGADDGTAILKDQFGSTHFLAIPTRRVIGIESPDILEPNAPNWFAAAWDARRYLFSRLGKELPRDSIALAVNSKFSRSQDQLHIHIDCVRSDVKGTLADAQSRIGPDWSSNTIILTGKRFWVKRIDQPDLTGINPFRLVADGPEKAGMDMGSATIVIVGATFEGGRNGFILLAGHANTTSEDYGHGGSLLDRGCAVAREPSNR